MTLVKPISEPSVVTVSDQQRMIVHVSRTNEAYEIEFSNPLRVDPVPS